MTPIGILNTTIITAPGSYDMREVTLDEARDLVATAPDGIDSAVSHPDTARILTDLLGVDVPCSRQLFVQQPGQTALAFKLRGRPESGREYTRQELEEIGFDFFLITRRDNTTARYIVSTTTEQGDTYETAETLTAEEASLLEGLSTRHWLTVQTAHDRAKRLAKFVRDLLAVDAALPHDDPADGSSEWHQRNGLVEIVVRYARLLGWPAGYGVDSTAPPVPCKLCHQQPHGSHDIVAYIDVPTLDGVVQCSWHLPRPHAGNRYPAAAYVPSPEYPREWDGTTREQRDAALEAWLAALDQS